SSSQLGGHSIREKREGSEGSFGLRISPKFVYLDEVRPYIVLETMAYHDKYKKVLDEIWKDKVELDGMIVKEEEEFFFDTGSDIITMPYRIYEQLGREEMKKVDKGIIMINHNQAEAMGILTNWLVGVSDTIGGIVNTHERLFSTFDGFYHQTFHAARSDVMRKQKVIAIDEEEAAQSTLAALTILDSIKYILGSTKLWEETMLKPDHQDPNALDNLKPWSRYCFYKFIMIFYYGKVATTRRSLEIDDMLRIKLREAESNEKIFTPVAWIRAFNIKKPIYAELCHEFYSSYKFDEVCVDDELQSKKIIKFRLGGRAHNLTLLEFACRLRLYHADELEEDGFDMYFQGGLRSDDNFNAQESGVLVKH
ncbi:hypothetical protein Tco_1006199, partial [Tanacetum coccineum]